MAGFTDTLELERSLLKALTSSEILARTYMGAVTEDLFSTLPRKFIYGLARQALYDSNSLLTKRVYLYGVGSRFDKDKLTPFIVEWDLVEQIDSYDPPEMIIAQLKVAQTGREVLKLTESTIAKLQKGDVEGAVADLKTKAMSLSTTGKVKHSKPLSDITERLELIQNKLAHPELFSGLLTGFKKFDQVTGGLFPGELTLLAGVTGLGKSTMCKALARNIITLNPGKNVLHVANEEYETQVDYKYDAAFTGIPYYKFKNPQYMEPHELAEWEKYMETNYHENGRGEIYPFEVPAFTDVTLVEQEYRYLENKGIKIDCIIIDHLPHIKPIQQAWNENDELKKAAADCKELARLLQVPLIVPTQAATEVEDKQMKGKRASKMDVYGSKGQVHVANTFVILTYRGTDDRQTNLAPEDRDVIWLVDCKKNRDGKAFCFEAIHHVNTGVVEEIDDAQSSAIHAAAANAAIANSTSVYSTSRNAVLDSVSADLDASATKSKIGRASDFIKKQKQEAFAAVQRDPNDTTGFADMDAFSTDEPPPNYGKPPKGANEQKNDDFDIFDPNSPF